MCVHARGARLTRAIKQTVSAPGLLYVCISLHLPGKAEVFHLLEGANL